MITLAMVACKCFLTAKISNQSILFHSCNWKLVLLTSRKWIKCWSSLFVKRGPMKCQSCPFWNWNWGKTGFFICDPHKVQVHAPLANMFAIGLLGFRSCCRLFLILLLTYSLNFLSLKCCLAVLGNHWRSHGVFHLPR